MVIGPAPSRSSSTENRAEVGVCEDYSPFQGAEKWAAECERDGGSFELNVDEESQNGHHHSYVPCRPRMEFEEDSVDLRAKRSAGTPLSEEEEEEAEEEEETDEEEEEEDEEDEEEQTYTETEYTAATSLMGLDRSGLPSRAGRRLAARLLADTRNQRDRHAVV